MIIGKNQDINYSGAYFFTNPRGVWKTALLLTQERPAVWRANYGSITLSQVGRELPNGGINEVGFVVEQTTLWETEYPLPNDRSGVTVYSVVYDLSSLELQLYTNKDTGIKRLSISDVSFENNDPCWAADMQLNRALFPHLCS